MILLVHGGDKIQILKLIIFPGRTHLLNIIIVAIASDLCPLSMLQDLLDEFDHGMLVLKNIECLELPDLR